MEDEHRDQLLRWESGLPDSHLGIFLDDFILLTTQSYPSLIKPCFKA